MRGFRRYLLPGLVFLALVGIAVASGEAKPDFDLALFILQPKHIPLILLVALIVAVLGGKNLGEFIRALFKKTPEVTIANISSPKPNDPQACLGMVDPALCNEHKAEHERSVRNEANIGELFKKVDRLKECFTDGFQQLSSELGTTKTEIIKTLAAKR
jgi:hypothetical protein